MLVLITLCLFLFLYLSNSDLLSPSKFFALNLVMFNYDVFISEYSIYTQLTYAIYVAFGFFAGLIEIFVIKRKYKKKKLKLYYGPKSIVSMYFIIVMASLVPLLSQLYMFSHFGGVAGYLIALPYRVINFAGLGIWVQLIGLYQIINAVYFVFLLTKHNVSSRERLLFCMHLLLGLSLALISGSRSSLLVYFLFMVVATHYFVKPLSLKFLSVSVITLVLCAGLIETARSVLRYSENGEMKFEEISIGTEFSKYGLITLELIYEQGVHTLYYGSTYLTLVTNFIPRAIWPDKPDTGGLLFTKEYTGDAWDGASNLSTGLLPEAYMNFSFAGGLFAALAIFLSLSFLLSVYYNKKCLKAPLNSNDVITFPVYTLFYYSYGGVLISEFTNLFQPLIFKIIFLVCLSLCIKVLVKSRVMEIN